LGNFSDATIKPRHHLPLREVSHEHKNIWSLAVDEALIISELKEKLGKDKYEVFLPANSQLKDIDLILINLEKMRPITLQVKGSRTYQAKDKEIESFGEGNSSWIQVGRRAIHGPSFRIDFFIFVLHNLVDITTKGSTKKHVKLNYLVIPADEFRRRISSKPKKEVYNLYIWLDDEGKRAFDYRDRNVIIELSDFLDNWDILKKQ